MKLTLCAILLWVLSFFIYRNCLILRIEFEVGTASFLSLAVTKIGTT